MAILVMGGNSSKVHHCSPLLDGNFIQGGGLLFKIPPIAAHSQSGGGNSSKVLTLQPTLDGNFGQGG